MSANSAAHAPTVPASKLLMTLRDTYIAQTRQCLLDCAGLLEELRRTVTILGGPVQAIAVSVHRGHSDNANLRRILGIERLFFHYLLEPDEAYLQFFYGGEFGRLISTVWPGDKGHKPYGPFSRQMLRAQCAVHKALAKTCFVGTFVVVDGAIVAEIPCANFERVVLLPIRTGRPCYSDPRRPIFSHLGEWLRQRATELTEGQRIVVGGLPCTFRDWSALERLDFENRRADLADDIKVLFDQSAATSDPVEPIRGDRLDLARGDGLAVLTVNDRGHDNAMPAAVLDLEMPIPGPAVSPPLTSRVLCRPMVPQVLESSLLDIVSGLKPHAEALLKGFGASSGAYKRLRVDRNLSEDVLNLLRDGPVGEQWLGPDKPPQSLVLKSAPDAWKNELVKTAGAAVNSGRAAELIDTAFLEGDVAWAEIDSNLYYVREKSIFLAQGPFPATWIRDLRFELARLSPAGLVLKDREAACISAAPEFVATLIAAERDVYDRIRRPLDRAIVHALDGLTRGHDGVTLWLWRRGRAAALLSRCEDTFQERALLGLIDLGSSPAN